MPPAAATPPTERRRYWRLPQRLVGASLLLLLLVQLATYAVVDAAVARNTQASLERQLEVGERVWLELLEQRAQRLRQGAAVLARDFGSKTRSATTAAASRRSWAPC